MTSDPTQFSTGLLLSGGVDSAILLGELLRRGRGVVPFYVRAGCVWEECELRAVERFLAAVRRPSLAELVVFDMPVGDLYDDHWSLTGRAVPDLYTSDEAVFLPGRNPLMLLKPALWCQTRGVEQLAMATLAANPFQDARGEFFVAFEAMLQAATGGRVQILRPFERLSKAGVMQLGRHLPLELTFSCLAPVEGLHCGVCNKCGERRSAFREIGSTDPTHYAAGPVLSVARNVS